MYEQEYLSSENNETYSQALRAGSRTYFFDVKKTRAGEYYLTITESKKHLSEEGTAIYKKYKLHLYKEDFYKFQEALDGTLQFIAEQDKTTSTFMPKNTTDKSQDETGKAIENHI